MVPILKSKIGQGPGAAGTGGRETAEPADTNVGVTGKGQVLKNDQQRSEGGRYWRVGSHFTALYRLNSLKRGRENSRETVETVGDRFLSCGTPLKQDVNESGPRSRSRMNYALWAEGAVKNEKMADK